MLPRDPLATLSRLLDTARERTGISALAVADDSGLLIAGAGSWANCEELAARAPLMAEVGLAVNDTVPTRLDVLARRSEVRRITVDGMRVFVCGEGRNAAAAVAGATQCVRRVLGRADSR
jgi:hypothetical protein